MIPKPLRRAKEDDAIRQFDRGLRDWDEVARRFNEKFGEKITAKGAWWICNNALKKMRERPENS